MGYSITSHDLEAMGGLAVMDAMMHWYSVDITLNNPGPWTEAKNDLDDMIGNLTEGRFWILLAREDELTNLVAYFVVHCENENDALKV